MTNNPFEDKKVLIVDGLNTFFRSVSTMNDITLGGHPMGGLRGTLYSINYAMKQTGAERCIVVFDGKGGSQYRRKMFKEYKENRRTIGPKTPDEQAVSDNYKDQLRRLIQYLNCFPVLQIIENAIEADDVIAYISQVLVDSYNVDSVYIMSSDKDFLQLVNEDIFVWSPTKKKLYDRDLVKSEYGVIPENIIWFRCFTGDASDNVPGIKGIGPKTVLDLPEITENPILYEDIQEFVKSSTVKKWKNISLDELERNYKLMQLESSIISGNTRLSILKKLENFDLSYNLKELLNMVDIDGTMLSVKWSMDFAQRSTI